MNSTSQALATAVQLHQSNQLREAETIYRQILQSDPGNADALHLLGLIASQFGHHVDAINLISHAVRYQPENITYQENLAIAYQASGDLVRAASTYERLLALAPENDACRHKLGDLLLELGRLEAAAECFSHLINVDPGNTSARLRLIATFSRMGHQVQVETHCRELIVLDPTNTRAYFTLSELTLTAETRLADVSRIQELLASSALTDGQRKDAHFALGNHFDRTGRYQLAFENYSTGNHLKAAQWDPALHAQSVSQVIDTFSPAQLRSFGGLGNQTELPIFIVGMPRSGTTLVEQIISCHPAVFGAGELDTMFRLASEIPRQVGTSAAYPQAITHLNAEVAARLADAYLKSLPEAGATKQRVTDKRTSNFHFIGLIGLLFPNARIIHCCRDKLDVCLSCFFQNFDNVPHSFDLRHLGKYFRHYERLMNHWRRVSSLRMLDVNYEDLVTNQTIVTKRIIEFCGLEWDGRCLDFETHGRGVSTASQWQVRKPLHARSVNRWKNYEPFLQPLLEALDE